MVKYLKRKLHSSKLKVELEGGLGNQLFQYYAGQYFATLYKCEVVYVIQPKSELSTNSLYVNFELNNFTVSVKYYKLKVLQELHRVIRFCIRKFKISQDLWFWFSGEFRSRVVGFDERLETRKQPKLISGYFQSYRYLPSKLRVNNLPLKNLSAAYLNLADKILIDKPIAIHIRGGDYWKYRDSVGILSYRYFADALQLSKYESSTDKIWLFSNDYGLSQEIKKHLKLITAKEIFENELTSAESMLLMSRAKRLIISNSTFSWWSAYLVDNPESIIAPETWFRNMTCPSDLIPSSWTQCKSHWI
jgi:hypothetical protein